LEKERMPKERRPKVRKNLAKTMARRKTSVKLNDFTAMSIDNMQPSVHIRNPTRNLQQQQEEMLSHHNSSWISSSVREWKAQ